MPIIGFHPLTYEPIYSSTIAPQEAKVGPGQPSASQALTSDTTVDSAGRFVAVFATFSVIDHDSDVTLPSAFARMEGKAVPLSSYGHGSWTGSMPIGSGTIHSTATHAEIRGHLLMDTEAGRHMYSVLKDHGSELSYGFVVLDSALGRFQGEPVRFLKDVEIFECSFVLRGAGFATGLIELDDDLAGVSPELREAITDFRRLEARIEHRATRAAKARPPSDRVSGYKVPPHMQPQP